MQVEYFLVFFLDEIVQGISLYILGWDLMVQIISSFGLFGWLVEICRIGKWLEIISDFIPLLWDQLVLGVYGIRWVLRVLIIELIHEILLSLL